MITIREAQPSDWEAIWPIFHAIVASGDTCTYPPDTTQEQACALWMSPNHRVFVAVDGEAVVGTYWIRPNQPGLGAHIANGAFMVDPNCSGRGLGRAMGNHALQEAKRLGYRAMQFNIVVSTNERAVALWKSLGFSIIGTIPEAFHHRQHGLVDAYIMHRFLD